MLDLKPDIEERFRVRCNISQHIDESGYNDSVKLFFQATKKEMLKHLKPDKIKRFVNASSISLTNILK